MLSELQAKLHHQFNTPDLLEQALTHRSYLNEHPDYTLGHNERLEFLGDAVLDLVVIDMLYIRFPEMTEGQLTRLRAALVRTESLAKMAIIFDLGDYLKLARGEDENGGRTRTTTLCNTFEAVMGALYLDAGLDHVRELIRPLFAEMADEVIAAARDKDAKSRLQEWTQAETGLTPIYHTVAAEGEDHDKTFTVEVSLGDKVVGWGNGKSKQSAEQAAAQQALAYFDIE